METAPPFDLLQSPSEGTILVEASAGTGKTFTIAALYLRLVLEAGLRVEEILVVTYTVAAAEELKDRIRRFLRTALDAFKAGRSDTPPYAALLARNQDRDRAVSRLSAALLSFDRAVISTIHAFCLKALQEQAFETANPFDAELCTDPTDIVRGVAEDYFRLRLYPAPKGFVAFALKEGLSVETLLDLARRFGGQPLLRVLPGPGQEGPPDLGYALEEDMAELQALWQRSRPEVETLLMTSPSLNRTRYSTRHLPSWVQTMDRYMALGRHRSDLALSLEKFGEAAIRAGVKRGCPVPKHPFFERFEAHLASSRDRDAAFSRALLWLRVGFLQYFREEVARRKRDRNLMAFDDLLFRVYEATGAREGAPLLARNLQKDFRAALIDEFQDTDPIQYAIFRRVFERPGALLFLVGDPKQAIYAFRGADLFAYLEAAARSRSRTTLTGNWRSEKGTIDAVNRLFSRGPDPFFQQGITFTPAEPARMPAQEPLTLEGKPYHGMEIWCLDSKDFKRTEKGILRSEAEARIAEALSGEILRLIRGGGDGSILLGDRPLDPGDLAVLVRANRQGRLVQRALARRRIPSVLYSNENLFDAQEAEEVQRLLSAILTPSDARLLRAALCTDLLGLSARDILTLENDEGAWEARAAAFREYHETWRRHGFIRMFRQFLVREAVIPRLMAFPDGERRATNVLHLSEILHQEAWARRLHGAGLIAWLKERRDPRLGRQEEHALRLESDERAVKVVTIHRSKGLEYPVVFCPFLWHGSTLGKEDPPLFHDPEAGGALTLDLGSEGLKAHRGLAEREALSENLRLLYVALTRAKSRVILTWGWFRKAGTSAMAYLLHGHRISQDADPLRALPERYDTLGDEGVRGDLTEAFAGLEKVVAITPLPAPGPRGDFQGGEDLETDLRCRTFGGRIDRSFGVTSYSSLLLRHQEVDEEKDRDALTGRQALPQLEDGEAEGQGIFAFPRGTGPGIFLHDLLENLDFTRKETEYRSALVRGKLAEHGIAPFWEETLLDMLETLCRTPLDPDTQGLCLGKIPPGDRINELLFYCPLNPLTPAALAEAFGPLARGPGLETLPERLGSLAFSPVRGFLKGFMDTVFLFEGRYYLVDWKSNHLGGTLAAYDREQLLREMIEEHYVLQYHLYAMALNRYLQLRVPGYAYDTHFGGVFYVFLRGLDASGGDHGIFRDRPEKERIEALGRRLLAPERPLGTGGAA